MLTEEARTAAFTVVMTMVLTASASHNARCQSTITGALGYVKDAVHSVPPNYEVEPSLFGQAALSRPIAHQVSLGVGALATLQFARSPAVECGAQCGPTRNVEGVGAYLFAATTIADGARWQVIAETGVGGMALRQASADSYPSSGTFPLVVPSLRVTRRIGASYRIGFQANDIMVLPGGARAVHGLGLGLHLSRKAQ